ncbi:hypothetical protein CC86DRAFT_399544 [Ophiobolus disseminans]|uniref:Uncharacterized protein n=1 Tax=Ophiobolus disseminans TaxID=1469910 RepID=A0A6A7AJI9_9PLEO|nr:hypothetical protein CC86DRAFT_399544 [Ophiobolus disseminans]
MPPIRHRPNQRHTSAQFIHYTPPSRQPPSNQPTIQSSPDQPTIQTSPDPPPRPTLAPRLPHPTNVPTILPSCDRPLTPAQAQHLEDICQDDSIRPKPFRLEASYRIGFLQRERNIPQYATDIARLLIRAMDNAAMLHDLSLDEAVEGCVFIARRRGGFPRRILEELEEKSLVEVDTRLRGFLERGGEGRVVL